MLFLDERDQLYPTQGNYFCMKQRGQTQMTNYRRDIVDNKPLPMIKVVQ